MQPEERIVDIRELYGEFVSVMDVRKQAWEDHADNIRGFRAKPDDIEAWYFANDPLESSFYFMLDTVVTSYDVEQVQQLMRQEMEEGLLLGAGGVSLLASTVFVDAFEDDNQDWLSYIDQKYYQPMASAGLVPDQGRMNGRGLVDLCEYYIRGGYISVMHGDVRRLFIAAEMLRESASYFYQAVDNTSMRILDQNDESEIEQAKKTVEEGHDIKTQFLLFDGSHDDFLEFNRKQNVLSDSVLVTLGQLAFIQDGEASHLSREELDEVKMTALRARSLFSSSWMSGHFGSEESERFDRAKQEFGYMVGMLEQIFGYHEGSLKDRIKNPNIKGGLHEVLWVVDAYVMRMAYPDKYKNIRAFPMCSRNDAPKIGYPKQKRGVDIMVMRNGLIDTIQLKSSPKRKADKTPVAEVLRPEQIDHLSDEEKAMHYAGTDEYHPEIIVLYEPNFLEVDPRRLAAKLKTYKRWLEADFAVDMVEDVTKYAMGSVKWEYETISGKVSDRTRQLRRMMSQNYILPSAGVQLPVQEEPQLNREQRRRAARTSRRKGSGRHR